MSESIFKNLTLKEIASVFVDGNWVEKRDQSNEGILLVQTGNIGLGYYRDKVDRKFVSEETFKQLKCKEIFPGDILISRLPDPVGKACIIPNLGIRMITAVDCTIFRPKKDFDTKYLNYLLNSRGALQQVSIFLTGSSRQRISRKNLEKIELPIPFKNNQPDLDEQKRIVDKIDKLFAEAKKAEKIVIENYKYTDNILKTELEELMHKKEKGWNSFNLNQLVKNKKFAIVDGPFGTQLQTKDYKDEGIPLIRIKNIRNDLSFDDSNLAYITEKKFEELERSKVEKGDILLAKTGATIGKVCLFPEQLGKGLITSSCAKISIDLNKSDIRYVLYLLSSNSILRNILDISGGATRNSLTLDQIKKLEIRTPTINSKPDVAKQKIIVKKLEQIRELSSKLRYKFKQQMENYNKLYQSILNRAFVGKLVTAEEPVLQRVNIFPIQQAIGAVLQRFERGEMVIAKVLYLAQTINRVPLGISFTPQNFGPYDTVVKKAITAGLSRGNNFFTRKKYSKGFIYALSLNAKKLFKYSNSKVLRTMDVFLNEMMPYFKKSSSADIERLASVCEIIRETKNRDEKEIYHKLSEWKPNKFNLQEVQRTLGFIKAKGWDKILIQ